MSAQPWGYRWRSSQAFIVFTAVLGLFSETFLYGFIVPILSYMLEDRLQLPPSQTQWLTTALLTSHGFFAMASAPIIAHFADKTSDRKVPLLLALAGCATGTLLVAICSSLWLLFLGRMIQAVAGSAGWIVGFATLTDNIRSEHVGKALGTAMSFVTAGVIMGPMVAGVLVQLLGYWAAWCAPFILLGMDFVARLLMIGKNDTQSESSEDAASDENEALLPRKVSSPSDPEQGCTELTGPGFYRIVLCDIRIIAALLNLFMFSLIISGFDATLPLHLRKIFNWGPLPIGMIFLGIQVPGMILGPVVGWLRDRVGLRYPTTVGWVLMAPLLCVLGMPGTGIDWISYGDNGKVVFIGGMIAIGAVAPLVRGAGTFQLIAVTNDLQAEKPTLFGPHGGSSRIFSITEVTFNMGAMLGPLFSGAIVEEFSFSTMVRTLGILSLAVALACFRYLSKECPKRR
ncbi:MFS transporter [Penicillium atrosanguineum]|uniref:MFS transporter n=1 Tax=Penicillium atrosanguineum TaxID=1132637 RepID=A0A9W9UD92_9EURO|nr:uncharacterized protein N7443_001562 [Penicillium atrosanguineum]KAJ5126633.1 MFS transporter [Penicillium atrosanguineum]KAJ5314678.1 hypothetical protein N7443_001562 [Penicillium atrosanguineum]KAJ5331848.1 MFS transporter [Penicillium atrosanguineum]